MFKLFLGLACFFLIINQIQSKSDFQLCHEKKFGSCGPYLDLEETDDISTKPFFDNYVKTKRALVIRKGALNFKAINLWTDDYLLKESIGYEDLKFVVETSKKENRDQEILNLSFSDFIKNYRIKDYYLVNDVPEFLQKDIVLPQMLQCEHASKGLDKVLMWLSSGNTQSVTHTDDYDNILCVLDGLKSLTLIDYYKHNNIAKTLIDRTSGSYSSMDVDNVDFNKFPGIETLEYYKVNLTAGDCIYIPFKWIHQVNSYERNIAVNFWFNKEKIFDQGEFSETCQNNKFDSTKTLNNYNLAAIQDDYTNFKAFLIKQINNGNRNLNEWKKLILNEDLTKLNAPLLEELVEELFNLLDFNGSGDVTTEEVQELSENSVDHISDILSEIDLVIKEANGEVSNENLEQDDEEHKDYQNEEEDEHNEHNEL